METQWSRDDELKTGRVVRSGEARDTECCVCISVKAWTGVQVDGKLGHGGRSGCIF